MSVQLRLSWTMQTLGITDRMGLQPLHVIKNSFENPNMSHTQPLAAPLVGKQALAVKLSKGRPPTSESANKGPVVRKSIEALYFAAHAYSKLHDESVNGDSGPDRGRSCNWIQVPSHGDASACKLAGLFSAWYPEISTLVLAYAAHDDTLEPVSTGSQHLGKNADTSTVFYLPKHWKASANSACVKLLHQLHIPHSSNTVTPSSALDKANQRLKSLSGDCEPLRVVVCGYANGGALASLAAPYAALAYPSADTRLITFGAPEVRSSEFMRLTEWTVGVRLRVVLDVDVMCTAYRETDRPGTELPTVNIRLPDDEFGINLTHGVSAHSLEAYMLALNSHFKKSSDIETSGSPYTNAEPMENESFFLSSPGLKFATQIQNGAAALLSSDDPHATALKWAANLNLQLAPGILNGPASCPEVSPSDPAYVAPSFSFIPGPHYKMDMDAFLQCLAIAVMKQPARYCVGAYAASVVPRDFIKYTDFSFNGENIALVSDPFSGADVYVGWSESSRTLLFAFRGTEIYEGADICTDLNIIQSPANVFQEVDLSKKACKKTSLVPVLSNTKNDLVHSGFLGQFQALTGMQLFSWMDLRSPLTGLVRGARAGLLYLLGMNAPFNMNPNIAKVGENMIKGENDLVMAGTAHKVSGGKTPLRVVCCGHSLGGALATIAAFWAGLTYPSADIRCITFGSPLVGNEDFVLDWRQVVGTRIRAVNGEDPVPSLPPLIGFTHVYPAVWLRRGQSGGHPPATVEIHDKGLERPWFDFRDERCLASALLGRLNIFDHLMKDGYYDSILDAEKHLKANEPSTKG